MGKRPPTVLPDLGEKKPCQKSKGQFVVGEYKTKAKTKNTDRKSKVKRRICHWKIQDKDKICRWRIQDIQRQENTDRVKSKKGNLSLANTRQRQGLIKTRSSWLNCALRDDEAVNWVSIGHYEAVAIGN